MKDLLRYCLLIVVPAALMYGCEGYSCAEGVVRDKTTFKAIDSAKITVLTAEDKVDYTDTTGMFSVCNYMSGCVPHCADIIIKISKRG